MVIHGRYTHIRVCVLIVTVGIGQLDLGGRTRWQEQFGISRLGPIQQTSDWRGRIRRRVDLEAKYRPCRVGGRVIFLGGVLGSGSDAIASHRQPTAGADIKGVVVERVRALEIHSRRSGTGVRVVLAADV